MGWASASEIAEELILSIQNKIPHDATRKLFYQDMLDVLSSHDWDTQQECIGLDPIFDEVLEENGYIIEGEL